MRTKKVRGYITARTIEGTIVPQKIQNLVLREFCKNNNYNHQLSSVEYKMNSSFLVLESILDELSNIDGIVMYSFFQLPQDEARRKEIFNLIFKKSKFISFALENITARNKLDFFIYAAVKVKLFPNRSITRSGLISSTIFL